MKKWTRVLYQPNLPLYEAKDGRDGRVTACKEHVALSKEAAGEGMVLLKNDKGLLPIHTGTKVALFGKGSFDYVKGGGGSGDVNTVYVRNLYEGLKKQSEMIEIYEPLSDYYRQNVQTQYAQGAAPGMTVEPELSEDLVKSAKAFADIAIITISRFSGEGWDRSDVEYNGEFNPWESETSMPKIAGQIFERGDFYLTKAEEKLVFQVKNAFEQIVVVLNVGGVVDTKWIKEDKKLGAALLTWQGGMEGGLAAAEILCGKINPSGRLTDTFAREMEDYPSTENFHESPHYVDYTEDIYVGYRYFETIPQVAHKVCYPFGYGLSYTSFELATGKLLENDTQITVQVMVTNTGEMAGKEVVQIYYSAPQGRLLKPAIELAAFSKTRTLLPGESQLMTISFAKELMASFDDLGKIQKSAYVMEKGEYTIYAGHSVRETKAFEKKLIVTENQIISQLSQKCAPTSLKERMLADGSFEELPQSTPHDPNECVLVKMEGGTEEAVMPSTRARERYMMFEPFKKGAITLYDVVEEKATLDEFVANLSEEELLHLLGGQPNTSVANTFGFGNLPEYGVPNIMTADGPAGLRIHGEYGIHTTAFPCATLLAATWNQPLVEAVGRAGAEEVKENNIAVWLTPAVNIHRNPYCGRNFEYYSEDPLVAGKMGAAMVRGIQSQHIAASVKHFACNNKETNRKHCDSRVSERALREIYLKQFEIIVKESDPWSIMSSYNVINGQRASENHELLEDILRNEWGFRGMVTSDWWTRGEHYKEIKAGNDVKMASGFPERVEAAMAKGAIDRKDLEHCAKRVLGLIMKIE